MGKSNRKSREGLPKFGCHGGGQCRQGDKVSRTYFSGRRSQAPVIAGVGTVVLDTKSRRPSKRSWHSSDMDRGHAAKECIKIPPLIKQKMEQLRSSLESGEWKEHVSGRACTVHFRFWQRASPTLLFAYVYILYT